jgi:site-specific recombinase XerD
MDVFDGHNRNPICIYIEAFLQHMKTLKYSRKSIESYKQALNRFSSFLTAINIVRIADVTPKDLDAYRLELVDRKYADQSISLYLRSVRKLFQYLEETQQIFINPARSLKIPRVKLELKPVPTEEEMKTLLAQPDISQPTGIRDRAVIETFYSTGARLEELTCMNAYDADLKQGRVKITGKGCKERVVPMGRQAVFWTGKYLKDVRPGFLRKRPDEHALWLGFAGKRINPLIVERFISDYGKTAGIRHPVTPHTLRRACATHMLKGGAHPVEIQMLLGHASLRVLSRYLQVTITDMMKTHSKGKPGK